MRNTLLIQPLQDRSRPAEPPCSGNPRQRPSHILLYSAFVVQHTYPGTRPHTPCSSLLDQSRIDVDIFRFLQGFTTARLPQPAFEPRHERPYLCRSRCCREWSRIFGIRFRLVSGQNRLGHVISQIGEVVVVGELELECLQISVSRGAAGSCKRVNGRKADERAWRSLWLAVIQHSSSASVASSLLLFPRSSPSTKITYHQARPRLVRHAESIQYVKHELRFCRSFHRRHRFERASVRLHWQLRSAVKDPIQSLVADAREAAGPVPIGLCLANLVMGTIISGAL